MGQQNARNGIIKVFNALQEASANKHLLYVRTRPGSCPLSLLSSALTSALSQVFMETFLKELCPELSTALD